MGHGLHVIETQKATQYINLKKWKTIFGEKLSVFQNNIFVVLQEIFLEGTRPAQKLEISTLEPFYVVR
jgi:hypothetical protein